MPPKTTAKPAATEVYSKLRASIMEGEIPPDTRINTVALARDLGVSQTPVREALQRLEGDNLITYQPGRGYSTTPLLDLTGLRALFEFRLLVEPWAARAAAVDRLSNPGTALDRELAAFERVLEQRRDGDRAAGLKDVRQHLVAHDAAFHAAILRASDNVVVEQAYQQTHCHLHTFRLYPEDIDTANTVVEHRRISEAISGCEPDLAEEAMAHHIRTAYERFAKAFADERTVGPPSPLDVPSRRLLP
ncbi:GntR family transcriptional regulator [Streptomyces sp. ME19-01-6]|uniref:GntR family transcriptional regulator n=1 Tax=Streptomyces sp. ME19-01-6 TaxID=3028686 RepID=UPI0029A13F1C|nr:GntR family transcriptional regulator [Streptomyces sp. ME19-01-6]MDX3231489.1 GntR family transcriptional regulator [Streptomyces sp. ME19-01-6]